MIGQYRIIVESDRPNLKETHQAGVPVLITGKTDNRYITLENVGRDELIIVDKTGYSELNRQSQQWRSLSAILGGQAAQAFLAESTSSPILQFQAKERLQVKTAEARIGIAFTQMVVDESGAYRASQEYRIENRTEPYLEVEMPSGSKLWTVHVAGQAIKPIAIVNEDSNSTNASPSNQTKPLPSVQMQRVRIPLVKNR